MLIPGKKVRDLVTFLPKFDEFATHFSKFQPFCYELSEMSDSVISPNISTSLD